MSTHNINVCAVLSDSKRITNSSRLHFLALSLLFVLSLTFSVIVYTPFSQPMSIIFSYRFLSSYAMLVPEGENPCFDKSSISFTVMHSLVVLLFSLFTTASITHSTWNEFLGRPLEFTSIMASFFPLAETYVMTRLILGLIFFAVGNLTVLVFGGILPSGPETDHSECCQKCCVHALQGVTGWEIVHEFGRMDVRLPFDGDEKAPRVFYVS